MPIPKNKQKLYGKIIGRMINLGKGQATAKDIAERAVVDTGDKLKGESEKSKVKKKEVKRRGSSKDA